MLPKGISPKAIWIVERGEGWEQYSNGLRIETAHAVPGDPRAYRTVSFERGQFGEWRDRPAGVLFHTSESDIWPLDAAHNENLTDSSQRLLRYLKRNKVYNYLIDPFGRTFRVVEEESKANHAGHSIWSDGDEVYLSLNNAFLGDLLREPLGGRPSASRSPTLSSPRVGACSTTCATAGGSPPRCASRTG